MKLYETVIASGIAAVVATVAPAHGQAPGLDAGVKSCQAISSDLGRLSCYDALARQPERAATGGGPKGPAPQEAGGAPPAPAAPMPPGGTGGWVHRAQADGLDQSVVESAILPSVSGNVGLINKPGMRQGPALVIRCKEKQTSIYVAFDLPVTGPAGVVPVQYRIGATAPTAGRWGRSQDNQAYGFWESGRAISLIRSLLGQDELYVRANPPDKFQSEAGFKLTGIDAAIQPVRAACGW